MKPYKILYIDAQNFLFYHVDFESQKLTMTTANDQGVPGYYIQHLHSATQINILKLFYKIIDDLQSLDSLCEIKYADQH